METWHYVAIVIVLLLVLWGSGLLTVSYSFSTSEHNKHKFSLAKLGNTLTQLG